MKLVSWNTITFNKPAFYQQPPTCNDKWCDQFNYSYFIKSNWEVKLEKKKSPLTINSRNVSPIGIGWYSKFDCFILPEETLRGLSAYNEFILNESGY